MYRIKEINGWYYIQKKTLFFWWVNVAASQNIERAKDKMNRFITEPKYHYPCQK